LVDINKIMGTHPPSFSPLVFSLSFSLSLISPLNNSALKYYPTTVVL
jgi:hypothetical protein